MSSAFKNDTALLKKTQPQDNQTKHAHKHTQKHTNYTIIVMVNGNVRNVTSQLINKSSMKLDLTDKCHYFFFGEFMIQPDTFSLSEEFQVADFNEPINNLRKITTL